MSEQNKRSVRVADLILREVAELLSRRVKDPRVQGVTLTGVEMSSDLKNAKIYFSHLGEAGDVQRAKGGLESAKGFIKREIGLRLDLKYVPEVVFIHDPSLKKGADMEKLLEKLRSDQPVDPVD